MDEIITYSANTNTNELVPTTPKELGQAANQIAEQTVFQDYQSRKSKNTLKHQQLDLLCFEEYLASINPSTRVTDTMNNPKAWHGITWGIVDGFVKWLLMQGYSLATINQRLTTVRIYASLANKAGIIDSTELLKIKAVKGYSLKEARKIDAKRQERSIPTRIGRKKHDATPITKQQLESILASLPNSPQGKRDRLMLLLFTELGLRVGELHSLECANFNLEAGTITFYREKVGIEQTHKLTSRLLEAAKDYITNYANGLLWRGSIQGHGLTNQKLSIRAINKRIRLLGSKVGIATLSPHDLRHYWATQATRSGVAIDRLMQAGGWASYAMPLRYVQAEAIANVGVVEKLE